MRGNNRKREKTMETAVMEKEGIGLESRAQREARLGLVDSFFTLAVLR
jgi:hypothetical protein